MQAPLRQPQQADEGGASVDDEAALFAWVGNVCGGEIVRSSQTSGGQSLPVLGDRRAGSQGRRCGGLPALWATPPARRRSPTRMRREAQIYRANRRSADQSAETHRRTSDDPGGC